MFDDRMENQERAINGLTPKDTFELQKNTMRQYLSPEEIAEIKHDYGGTEVGQLQIDSESEQPSLKSVMICEEDGYKKQEKFYATPHYGEDTKLNIGSMMS